MAPRENSELLFSIQKLEGGGISDPLVARIQLGLITLIDGTRGINYGIPEQVARRDETLGLLTKVYTACLQCRDTTLELRSLIAKHCARVADREVVEIDARDPRVIRVKESIDEAINDQLQRLTLSGARAMKESHQRFLRHLGLEIGFLFQKDGKFKVGIADMESQDSDAAGYLRFARDWYRSLSRVRNDIEHEDWRPDRVRYVREPGGGVSVALPEVCGLPVDQYATRLANQVLLFVEETAAHAIARASDLLIVVELPPDEREKALNARFRVGLPHLVEEVWRIAPGETTDFTDGFAL